MISLSGMTRTFQVGAEQTPVFNDVTVSLPTDRHCAILGAEQSGKSVLIRILAGVEEATRGSIVRYASLSFPVGFVRAFRAQLTARQNVEHAARLYGADPNEVAGFVDGVTGFGMLMNEPVRRLQLRDRVTLAYAMSYAIPFDTYLIDENIALGSAEFREVCHAMFAHRAAQSGFLLATRNVRKALDYCDCAAVILNHKIVLFDDMKDAIDAYQEQLARRPPSPPSALDRVPEPLPADGF
jgi:capsular polysaccharide transport system ATP-binding protein